MVLLSSVPEGARVLPAVWEMRRKREIQKQRIYKWKILLNVSGHCQRPGIDYDPNTYSPVVGWITIHTYLIFVLLKKRKTRQIDFVFAYPHAPTERELFIHIPRGFKIPTPSNNKYVLKILQNICGT